MNTSFYPTISTCDELMQSIHQLGFLPLLESGIPGFNAEAMVDDECRYVALPDGGWDWPLWKWKGPVVTGGDCVYGKFFAGKAGFISREWWPDFSNWRRSMNPEPEAGSVEEAIVSTLRERGSAITRELRSACGFTGPKMRGRFDAYITRLQMACRIVTEDFVYPRDRHGRQYGWGWALLTTPEGLLGREACICPRTPQESHDRMAAHLAAILPHATDRQIQRLLK
ncbi:MAG: hypothetical protein IJT30_08510 [Muribaculaceae bacterium]|nr:hypothetical protein [Muribaculaceae bacterium]